MNELATGASILGGVSLTFGTVLAVAYRFLRVEEDPRIDEVEAMLPGTNCGACGEPGCRALAERVVGGDAAPGCCTVCGAAEVDAIANLLGVDAGRVEKRVARLHCAGGQGLVHDLAPYRGTSSCQAAVLVNRGGRACAWGCLGLGDCADACTFDAIAMSRNRLPVVDPDRCTACNDCVEVCPMDLFSLVPVSQPLVVQCASPMVGDAARRVCTVACDGCARCVADAGEGVLELVGGLPVIRLPDRVEERCIDRCPTGAIQWVEGRQFLS